MPKHQDHRPDLPFSSVILAILLCAMIVLALTSLGSTQDADQQLAALHYTVAAIGLLIAAIGVFIISVICKWGEHQHEANSGNDAAS